MLSREFTTREEFEERLRDRVSPENLEHIMLAYRLAKYAHRGQLRDDGVTRYFDHPKRVVLILVHELGIYDHEMIIAALLHDIKEDTFMLEWRDIEIIFGTRVREMVDVLTKEVHLKKPERDKRYKKRLKEADRQTKLIKLADRLDNLRDLGNCGDEKKRRYIRETLRDYAPLAEELSEYIHKELIEICSVSAETPSLQSGVKPKRKKP